MNELPGSRGRPIVGEFFAYQANRIQFLARMRKQYGDLFTYRMGNIRMVFLAHPDDVNWVSHRNIKNYAKATNLGEILGKGILTSEGELWRHQRKLIQPIFHQTHLLSLVPLMNEQIARSMDALEAETQCGRDIEVRDRMLRMAYEIVGQAVFGANITRHFDPLHEAMDYLNGFITRRLYQLVKVPIRVPLPSHRRFIGSVRTLDAIVYSIIREKSQAPPGSKDLVSLLIQSRSEETGEGMDEKQVRDESVTLLLAGHETTAHAISWTLYLLAKHPEHRRRVQAEIDAVLGSRLPGFEDLAKLSYLSKCIDESLRIYTPVWAWIRKAVADDEIRGYRIPAGSIILMSPYISHRHEEFWPDPERFDPSRFDESAVRDRNRFAYFPFGLGPRQCIGKHFALMEVNFALAQLLGRFDCELADPSRVAVPDPKVTMGMRRGLKLRFTRRERMERAGA
jgi:cytochrome P450